MGWQLQPVFSVVQGESSVRALELIQDYFGCGRIYRNRRHDNHREDLMQYQVSRRADLLSKIIPFFEANPLRTVKSENFRKFAEICRMMEQGVHLTIEGMRSIALISQTMNTQKRSRFLESSEAIRQPALLDAES